MKKFGLLVTLLGVFGFAGAHAASTNTASVTIQITAAIQKSASVTNNGVTTTTYTSATAKIANADILKMLSVEFATQFPAGAQLAFNMGDNSGFVVLNANGDIILNASTNAADSSFSFSISNNVTHAGAPEVYVGKEINNHNTTNHTFTATISQPDYGVFYQDSHGNKFHFIGMVVEKASAVVGSPDTIYKTVTYTLSGTGGGDFFNPASGHVDTAVFTAGKLTISGKDVTQ